MTPEDRPFLWIFLAVGIALAISVGFGGLAWPNDPPPGPNAPVVHVTNVRWTPSGCGLAPVIGTGANGPAGGRLTVDVPLGNASLARSCVFLGVGAATLGFSVVNGTMIVQLPYDQLTVLYVTVLSPPTYWSGSLNLTVSVEAVG